MNNNWPLCEPRTHPLTRRGGAGRGLARRGLPAYRPAYTHDDAIDLDTGTRELRVPADSFSGALLWSRGKFDAGLTLRSESEQSDISFDSNTTERPGFTVASLAGGFAMNDHVTLTARIENLANTHYEESFGYGEPGRSVYVGVRIRD